MLAMPTGWRLHSFPPPAPPRSLSLPEGALAVMCAVSWSPTRVLQTVKCCATWQAAAAGQAHGV